MPIMPDGIDQEKIVLDTVTFGGPFGTVPELLFEKKQLIPGLQRLLFQADNP
jgi:hypothetical protein